jgi:hypothetical protein
MKQEALTAEKVTSMETTDADTAQPTHSFWTSPRWYHALTLTERIAALPLQLSSLLW